MSSVTEAAKTPLYHLTDAIENMNAENGSSTPGKSASSSAHKRRSSKGKGKLTPRDHSAAEPHETDAVHVDPWPDTDELDLIDIMRVRHPLILSVSTFCNEIMLVVVYTRYHCRQYIIYDGQLTILLCE